MFQRNVVPEKDSGTVEQRLPSRSNLPHWTRLNTLDTARYPRPFQKDRKAFPGDPVGLGPRSTSNSEDEKLVDNEDEVRGKKMAVPNMQGQNSQRRLQYLERSLELLKKQHCEILQSLHQEIDDLKRQNKDLNFKLVMSHRDSKTPPASRGEVHPDGDDSKNGPMEGPNGRGTREGNYDIADKGRHDDDDDGGAAGGSGGGGVEQSGCRLGEGWQQQQQDGATALVKDFPEGESSDLTDTTGPLDDLAADGSNLNDITDDTLGLLRNRAEKIHHSGLELDQVSEGKLDQLKILLLEEELRKHQQRNTYISRLLEQSEEYRRHQIVTIESLHFQLAQFGTKFHHDIKFTGQHSIMYPGATSNIKANQHPSIPDLENTVKALQQINDSQSHELEALKTDLRDVLYSHKWTPDAYLIAKAYIAVDDAKCSQKDDIKPRKTTRNLLSKKELEERGAASVAENLTLPPLKQTVGNAAVERRKRTRTLQKRRLKDRQAMI